MATGVSFNDVHSYDAWGLRLKLVENELPEAKTRYVDVPGMDGELDLTEAEQYGVKYGMRTLRFTFDARKCNYDNWATLISDIAATIEGEKCEIVEDWDKDYYYTGRAHISTEKTNQAMSEITIECYCDPFKIAFASISDAWLWDPFSFVDGVIDKTHDISIDSTENWQKVEVYGYDYNSTINIISDSDMEMFYDGVEYQISAGSNYMYDVWLEEGVTNALYFRGKGTITISREGGVI